MRTTCKTPWLIALSLLIATGMAAAAPARTGESKHSAGSQPAGRLFYLSLKGGEVLSANTDGSDRKVLQTGHKGPDGIAVDLAGGHIYWTNMGRVKENDGSIERSNLDGTNLTTIVAPGGTFTPKQLKIDKRHGKLYWSDREGMRIMRSNLDGSQIETLVETAQGEDARRDARNWCVGIALDVQGGKIYWTQKGNGNDGTIRRASLEIPKGEDPAHRSDIEVLFDGLPEPIDLDLDLAKRMMYWTDRGDPPKGNTVNRAPMNPTKGATPKTRNDQQILVSGLKEGIGIALDLQHGRVYFTDIGGMVYSAKLDGSDKQVVLSDQGPLTGITYVEPPK
jgi:hypothetical protein